MTSTYVLLALLSLCLAAVVAIHIGYVRRVRARFTNLNLAYLFSMWHTAMNSIMLNDVPPNCISAGSNSEDPKLIYVISQAVTDYLQTWHWAMVSVLTISRLPAIKLTMSVSHQTTYLDDLGNQVAYAFQVTLNVDDHLHSFPLIVSNGNVSKVVGKMTYHADQLEQLINQFMRKG